MDFIGNNRQEAIDWVQDILATVARPLAENTYFAMQARGFIVEYADEVMLVENIYKDEVRQIAKEDDVLRRNNTVRHKMTRRHNSSTFKKQRRLTLKQGNTIDCTTDEIYQ